MLFHWLNLLYKLVPAFTAGNFNFPFAFGYAMHRTALWAAHIPEGFSIAKPLLIQGRKFPDAGCQR